MAGEVIVGVVAQEILKKLASFAAEEINLAWGLKAELNKLNKKLNLIQAVLQDAEGRREKSVRLWLKNLKTVADDAVDVVDEFEFEILRRKLEIQIRMRNKVRDFFSNHNPIAFRFQMAHKLKKINTMLAQAVREGNELGLNRSVDSTNMATKHGENRLITHPFVGESNVVVGRDGDISKIKDMLLNSGNDKDLSIIAIVGMAGLGKTTAAQLVYQNETVMRHFSERLWVCVSDDFDAKRILNEMVESHTRGSGAMSNIEAIIKEFNEIFKEKKCLLVLDDVWNTDVEKWDCLKNSLLAIGTSTGSKIMITTRSNEVASIMQSACTHTLLGLSENDSWILFQQKAFASGGAKETPNLDDVGRRIVKRCGGLPLAIKTLGGLMHSKKEEHEWLLIENSEIWALREGEKRILTSLQLSYDNLPSQHLKQCFAYCSIFPKDFILEKEDLIQRWMAQGFLQPSEGSSFEMEDIGNDYFNILLWSSLFQDAEVDEIGNIIRCKMHDLVHDLAQFISGSQCLTLGCGQANDALEARHILMICNEEIAPTIPRESAGQIRTLILRHVDVLGNSLLNVKCLRVLDLNGANIVELPTSICKLKHLRYLDVSRTWIHAFPTFICELYNLQTLRFLYCAIELPRNLKYLINLRHIYFTHYKYSNLREPMPIEMQRLTCLQTLPIFFAGLERGHQVEELGYLNKLKGTLKICNLQHVGNKEEAKRANLAGKANLNWLTFEWSSSGREGDNNNNKINDEDVLEGLQPHPNLKILKIENFWGLKFPSWLMKMSSNTDLLVEVRLINCKKCEQIAMLGQLRSLRVVEIEGMDNLKCIGTEFYGDSNNNNGGASEIRALFPALEKFSLISMENLVEWMDPVIIGGEWSVFPCLEKLKLDRCRQLTTVPSHFPVLRELEISEVNSGMPLANISGNLSTLTSLTLNSVSELSFLPDGLLENNKNLRSLRIYQCEKLSYLPNGIRTLSSLQRLHIIKCHSLESIPNISCLTSLLHLDIDWCDGLKCVPSGLQSCTSLENLTVIGCPNLTSFTEDLRELQSLSSLDISSCKNLKCLPEGLHCLTRLKRLSIGRFREDLHSFPNFINPDHIPSLQSLTLVGWAKLKSLPHQLQYLTPLTSLSIWCFDGVEALPEWLGNLSSLQELEIRFCKNLMHLPTVEAMRRLTKLQRLDIWECPILKERCAKDSGSEWCKISHIPRLDIK